jgi:hypothetical protein
VRRDRVFTGRGVSDRSDMLSSASRRGRRVFVGVVSISWRGQFRDENCNSLTAERGGRREQPRSRLRCATSRTLLRPLRDASSRRVSSHGTSSFERQS